MTGNYLAIRDLWSTDNKRVSRGINVYMSFLLLVPLRTMARPGKAGGWRIGKETAGERGVLADSSLLSVGRGWVGVFCLLVSLSQLFRIMRVRMDRSGLL